MRMKETRNEKQSQRGITLSKYEKILNFINCYIITWQIVTALEQADILMPPGSIKRKLMENNQFITRR